MSCFHVNLRCKYRNAIHAQSDEMSTAGFHNIIIRSRIVFKNVLGRQFQSDIRNNHAFYERFLNSLFLSIKFRLSFAIVLLSIEFSFLFNAFHSKFVISIEAYDNAMRQPYRSTDRVFFNV